MSPSRTVGIPWARGFSSGSSPGVPTVVCVSIALSSSVVADRVDHDDLKIEGGVAEGHDDLPLVGDVVGRLLDDAAPVELELERVARAAGVEDVARDARRGTGEELGGEDVAPHDDVDLLLGDGPPRDVFGGELPVRVAAPELHPAPVRHADVVG